MYKQNVQVCKNLCFIIMPFDNELEQVHKAIKEVIVVEHNMSCLRADDIYSTGVIIEEIWEGIQKAQIIIADITGKNPNVLYELGIAHSLRKDVIILAQTIGDVPFDLKHKRVIVYNINRLDVLKIKLSKTVEEIKAKPIKIFQWINTDKTEIKIGLFRPIDKTIVHESPIVAVGRTVGLLKDFQYRIQGYIITDKTYEQGTSIIDDEGYWKISELHLGATTHLLYFIITDEAGRIIAKSEKITIYKH